MNQVRLGKKIPPSFSLDLDFAVSPGVLAICGPPGAGKTVLLEMIAGFLTPDSGRILLADAIVYDAQTRVSLPPRRRACGYVTQRDTLFSHLTLRRNLAFAAQHVPRLVRQRRVAEMLERFALTSSADSLPCAVSPRERRDAAAARALIAAPRLLLLDERGWDEPSLRTIREAANLPILLVTADLDLCCSAASQLVLLDAGRIVQRGAPSAVADRPESIEAARLLGFPNVFSGAIAALDPGRNTSRIEFENFALGAPYIRGHFRGDRVSVAIHPADIRVRSGDLEPGFNCIPASLVRVLPRARTVRLEFAAGLVADLSPAEYARQKDNKNWQLEFPPEALRIL